MQRDSEDLQHLALSSDPKEEDNKPQSPPLERDMPDVELPGYDLETLGKQDSPDSKRDSEFSSLGSKLHGFLAKHVDMDAGCNILCTGDLFNIAKLHAPELHTIVNLQRINDVSGIDDLLRTTNHNLPVGGRFVGCVETLEASKERIFKKHNKWKAPLVYISDFVVKRVLPKLKLTRSMYFLLTGGKDRSISKTEALGRCIFCGFRIDSIEELNGLLYFVCSKTGEPMEGPAPSKGMLLRIPRIGKDGKRITIYKFRTMHPYAQYLQGYVFEKNKLKKGGKFNDDWRITKWGRFMRTFWLDELPMLWNWLRGDMKLVGVRPLSQHYFGLYSTELQEERIAQKPGLIPPFYADLPETLPEIMNSEFEYLKACKASAIYTDLRYGWLAMNNILSGKAKSS